MHRRAHAVAVAKIDIVAHADLVAVIEHGRARHRQQQRVQQLDLAAVVLEQRREAAANAEIDARAPVGGIERPQIIALAVGHHGERHLVMVAQKDRPLRAVRNLRRLAHDVGDRMTVLLRQRHIDARHQGKVERHVAFVALPEISRRLLRPDIGLGEQHAVGIAGIDRGPDLLDDRMRLGQVLACRPLALDEIGDGVEAQAVDPHVEPEAHHVEDGLDDARIVEIEIRLMRIEAVPVERLGRLVKVQFDFSMSQKMMGTSL